jgi:hypothetical protein
MTGLTIVSILLAILYLIIIYLIIASFVWWPPFDNYLNIKKWIEMAKQTQSNNST